MELSYELHTGNELELMRLKKKPLSMFYMNASAPDMSSFYPAEEFDRLVAENILIREEHIFEPVLAVGDSKMHREKYIFYAQVDEYWRIKALILVINTQIQIKRFDEGLDRMMGSLLGYSDEENEEFQSRISK